MTPSHPFVHLMRRYVLEYLACCNTPVCPEIMAPDYLLYMDGHDIGSPDEVYVPAVAQQMVQFPGVVRVAAGMVVGGRVVRNGLLA